MTTTDIVILVDPSKEHSAILALGLGMRPQSLSRGPIQVYSILANVAGIRIGTLINCTSESLRYLEADRYHKIMVDNWLSRGIPGYRYIDAVTGETKYAPPVKP